MTQIMFTRVIIAALASAALPMAVAAQDDAGGLRLTFDLSQRIDATTNNDLTDTETTPQQSATTRISAALLSQTRSETLSFNLSTGFETTSDGTDVADPSAALSYSRIGPGATLDLTANWAQASFESLRSLTDFTDADGTLVLPDDLDDLTGDGLRTTRSAGATLRWGEDGPLGASLGVTVSDLRYAGTGTGDLDDSRSASLTTGLRLNLNPVSTADISLRTTRTDDGDISDTTTLTAGYTLDRPRGPLTATLTATRDADTRLGLSFGRSYALPEATLNASLGVSQNANGDPALTGRLAWQQTLPTGQISLNIAQAVATGTDADTDTTTLSGSYAHSVTARGSLQLGFDFARASDPDDTLTTTNLTASYGYALTPDWQLNVGATRSLRDADDIGRTQAQSVFMSLGRSLSLRP